MTISKNLGVNIESEEEEPEKTSFCDSKVYQQDRVYLIYLSDL